MNARRSWMFFLTMLLFSFSLMLLVAWGTISENIQVLRNGNGEEEYSIVGVGPYDIGAAARWEDQKLALHFFNTGGDGKALSVWSASLPEELERGVPVKLFPVRENLVFLGIFGQNAESLSIYRLKPGTDAEMLLDVPCRGETYAERVDRIALSEFGFEDGEAVFAVKDGVNLTSYRCGESGGVVVSGEARSRTEQVRSFYALPGGLAALGGSGTLTLDGVNLDHLVKDQTVTTLTRGKGGWYYIDASNLAVCFVSATGESSQRLYRLGNAVSDGDIRSASISSSESAIFLVNGKKLVRCDEHGTEEMRGVLYPSSARCIGSLAKYAVSGLLLAALLWLLLCGMRHGYTPLAVFRGGALITLALIYFLSVVHLYATKPAQQAALRENQSIVSGAVRCVEQLAGDTADNATIRNELCRALESPEDAGYHNVRVVVAEKSNELWRVEDGSRAEMTSGFHAPLAENAERDGKACELGENTFRYAFVLGSRNISISVDNAAAANDEGSVRVMFIGVLLIAIISMLFLLTISGDLRRLAREMERISKGGEGKRLEMHTGDELETMASIVNSLDVSLREKELERQNLEHSYRRFVPEKVLLLLGKKSIEEVDKSSFAARHMAVMTVWFTFPESVYTTPEQSRLLFYSVNEVIERTASIATGKGGTVFHFSYDGFDVVMDENSGEVVSTAIAIEQEVLSFNETRADIGLPTVTLRVAMDVGNVMLGVVGDSKQMEPTTISPSFTVVNELVKLCNQLEAGILCTEAVLSEGRKQGNRYMGKCVVGDQQLRVYEVFDGDEYRCRKGKAASVSDFSKGVFELYSGDPTSAKRMFLQLTHNYPLDGGARYYLYLADRMSHDPTFPCVLNPNGSETSKEG